MQAEAAKLFARAYWGLPQLQPELAAQALHGTLPGLGMRPSAALAWTQSHAVQQTATEPVSRRSLCIQPSFPSDKGGHSCQRKRGVLLALPCPMVRLGL